MRVVMREYMLYMCLYETWYTEVCMKRPNAGLVYGSVQVNMMDMSWYENGSVAVYS